MKTNATDERLKLQESTNNQQKKDNSVKHLQRQQFSFTKTSIKASLKTESLSLSLKLLAGFLVFTVFKDELEARKSLKAFFLQPKL